MTRSNGSLLLARSLRLQGVDTLFFLMGGPMVATAAHCVEQGIRMIDVRHEQAAAMMAHAWSRVLNRPGVCMACSGPGAANLVTGVATAWADAVPLVAIGGSSAAVSSGGGRGAFQELDQVSLFRPITKWSERVPDVARIPEMVAAAFRQAVSGRPGPVYLDFPGDVLDAEIDDARITWFDAARSQARERPHANPHSVDRAVQLLAQAERPIVLTGSGVLWSGASAALTRFVDAAGLPFYTTPQGRGVVPDDHPLSFLAARATAFAQADLLLVVGTRANYVSGHLVPPRFRADAKLVMVNIDPTEIGLTRPCDAGLVGDAAAVLEQLADAIDGPSLRRRYAAWVAHLHAVDAEKTSAAEARMSEDAFPMHPLRLCKEVRDFLERDAILVVDGQEILNYGRQSIPTYVPGHRLNSGTFGTMGVGLPFGIGAKIAKPDAQVLVLHGDGSFGMNAMELDTAVRFGVPVVTVISLNGGWAADEPGKVGRFLGYTRYERMAQALGCHGEYVERPQDVRGALERAFASGKPAVVNVLTEAKARARTTKFAAYTT